jgi:aurora kinase, other
MGWLSHFRHKTRNKEHPNNTGCVYGLNCPRALQTKLALSDFRFLRAIGHGYASTVFEAEHSPTKLHCVVKVCMKARLNADETRRIQREIRIHSSIHHRHILTFYAAFEDANAYYLILEYASQGDLLTYIREQPQRLLNKQRFLMFVLRPLLHAVSYLHELGILHRDIKPENILLDHMGCIQVCDFGLSIHSYQERPRSIVGTLEYMSPELIEHRNPPYTAKIDVWAIGVLTYECLVGRSPFAAPSDAEIIQNIKTCTYDASMLAEDVRNFLSRCLVPDPADRASIQDLLGHELLCPLLQHGGNGSRRSYSF